MPSIVSCAAWVSRGIASESPEKVVLDPQELEEVIHNLKKNVSLGSDESEQSDLENDVNPRKKRNPDPADSDSEVTQETGQETAGAAVESEGGTEDSNAPEEDDIEAQYGLDTYDDEDNDIALEGLDSLAFYGKQEEDPYLAKSADAEDSDDDEDNKITEADNLVLAGRAAPECCLLEVYVFNEQGRNLYCHHDIVLPAFPLAVECVNFDPGEGTSGNLAAVGSMDPSIDLWDLDLINAIEPAFKLGQKPKRKAKQKKKKAAITGHADAVLDLSWNKLSPTVLASASADCSCIVWDLKEGKPALQIKQADKVQTISWHPHEAQTLLSGAFDQTVRLYDCRTPHGAHKKWTLSGEVERVTWSAYNPYYFFASSDQGYAYYMDTRVDAKPVFTLQAHDEAVTGLCQNHSSVNCLVTGSMDGIVKVWSIQDGHKPQCLAEKPMKMGGLHCTSPCPDSQFIYAIGSEKELKVWDIRQNADVEAYLSNAAAEASGPAVKVPVDLSVGGADSEEEDELGLSSMPASVPTPMAPVVLPASAGGDRKRKRPKKKSKKR